MPAVLLRLLLFSIAFYPFRALAQDSADAPHVRVELLAEKAALLPLPAGHLGLRFVLEKGWHLYWQNPGDSGEAPRVNFTLPPDQAERLQIGPLKWPTPQRLSLGPLVNYAYEDEVLLLAPLQVRDSGALPASILVTADVTWLVCSETCIPGKARLLRTLPLHTPPTKLAQKRAAELAALFATAERALPLAPPPDWRIAGQLDANSFLLRIEMAQGRPLAAAQFFPFLPDQIENAAPQEAQTSSSTLRMRLRRSDQLLKDPASLRGLLVFGTTDTLRSYAVDIPLVSAVALPTQPAAGPSDLQFQATPVPIDAPPLPLWWALLLALLGGALLNLMPCVFPVLSMKALGILQMLGTDRRVVRGQALAYTGGILVSFWILAGLLIGLRYTGQQIGWGFQLQSPRFLLVLAALLFFLGLNLLGIFELGIGMTRLGQLGVNRHGYAGAFATGILATVVATPCTAPFMGTAVGFALSQPPVTALLIFSCLGLGLALPYVLLLWIPGLGRLLPRPGAWMETFKQLMGFLLFVTVLWLAWVLGGQAGADAVVALLAGLLLIGLAAWVLHRFEPWRFAPIIAALLVGGGAAIPGFFLARPQLAENTSGAVRNGSEDLPWEPFSSERLAAYRRAGTPVFVDFTADWCVSCKVNERLVLRSSAIRARMATLGVVAMKADWTHEDPIITQALQSFGRSGVPLYVIYGRDSNARAKVLPAVLSTSIVLEALDALNDFPQNSKPSIKKGQTQP